MKKIVLAFVFALIASSSVFAENTLDITTDSPQVTLGDTFNVSITLKSDGGVGVNKIDIAGMENFTDVSHTNSTRVSIIHWKTKSEMLLRLTLQAVKEGNFTLWPARVNLPGNKQLISWKVDIQVSPLLPSNSPKSVQNQTLPQTPSFHDIQNPTNSFSLQKSFFLVLTIGLFLLFFYYLLSKHLSQTTLKPLQTSHKSIQEVDKKSYLLEQIKKLQHDSDLIERSIFYERLNHLQREFLEHEWVSDATKKTIAQLQKIQCNSHIKDIIHTLEKSYFLEFNNTSDAQETRKTSIEDFKRFL